LVGKDIQVAYTLD